MNTEGIFTRKKLSHCPVAHPSCLFLGKARTVITERIGSPGSVSSLEFGSRRLHPSGRSGEPALAADDEDVVRCFIEATLKHS